MPQRMKVEIEPILILRDDQKAQEVIEAVRGYFPANRHTGVKKVERQNDLYVKNP